MYREHLLSINHVQNLLYRQVSVDGEPAHFISQGDRGFKGEFFPASSEAERCTSLLSR